MRSQWEYINPARARLDLETAKCGRNPSGQVVDRYARDMQNYRWVSSPEPLIYDGEGTDTCHLRDGQHRAYALIKAAMALYEAGKIADPDEFTLKLYVTRGTTEEIEEAFPYLNTGKNRSPTDWLFMHDFPNGTLLYSVARRLAMWQAEHPTGTSYKPTRAEVFALITGTPETPPVPLLMEAAEFASTWSVRPPVPAAATAGFLWHLLGTVSPEDRDVFMEYLRSSTGLTDVKPGRVHPVVLLRSRLHADQYTARSKGQTVKQETVLWLCLRAWRAWLRGEELKKLQIPVKLSDASFEDFLKPQGLHPRR